MTEYLLLERTKDGDWSEVSGTTKASSAKSAIRKALSGQNGGSGGEFVAVPARSWQPVKVAVEQALKFS